MSWLEYLLLAAGLALDASAVSLAAACCGYAGHRRAVFRLSFHFALFQSGMPLIGWLLGYRFVQYVDAWAHWIVFVILGFLGLRMIVSGFKPADCDMIRDPSRGFELVALSFATSVDALAVGLGLAFLETNVLVIALVIGVVTAVMTLLAIWAGRYLGLKCGGRMEILGGLVLSGLAVSTLIKGLN